MKSRISGHEVWRSRFREASPLVGRSQGTAKTKAWANSRDAGELLGLTARLHPQMRSCLETLGVGDKKPRWVPDWMIVRASPDDPRPLWGELMTGPEPRLRVALMCFAQGMDLAHLDPDLSVWEEGLGVEQVRTRAMQKDGPRDEKYSLRRALRSVREHAVAAAAATVNFDPRGTLREERDGSHVPSRFELQIAHLPEVPLDDSYYKQLGWTVRPPAVPNTKVADGLFSQGWHLVTPPMVLGWMVALPLLHEPKGRARYVGERHLGLTSGFQAAARARYFLKLSREHPDLATLTLQRNILWALAELEVVPSTVTDVGAPIQTLLLGMHEDEECCVLISGDHLRVWYREDGEWQTEPHVESLHDVEGKFSMATLGRRGVQLDGVRLGRSKEPVVLRDLTLHTFPGKPWQFPAKAWKQRTGLDPRFVIPESFLDEAGNVLPL